MDGSGTAMQAGQATTKDQSGAATGSTNADPGQGQMGLPIPLLRPRASGPSPNKQSLLAAALLTKPMPAADQQARPHITTLPPALVAPAGKALPLPSLQPSNKPPAAPAPGSQPAVPSVSITARASGPKLADSTRPPTPDLSKSAPAAPNSAAGPRKAPSTTPAQPSAPKPNPPAVAEVLARFKNTPFPGIKHRASDNHFIPILQLLPDKPELDVWIVLGEFANPQDAISIRDCVDLGIHGIKAQPIRPASMYTIVDVVKKMIAAREYSSNAKLMAPPLFMQAMDNARLAKVTATLPLLDQAHNEVSQYLFKFVGTQLKPRADAPPKVPVTTSGPQLAGTSAAGQGQAQAGSGGAGPGAARPSAGLPIPSFSKQAGAAPGQAASGTAFKSSMPIPTLGQAATATKEDASGAAGQKKQGLTPELANTLLGILNKMQQTQKPGAPATAPARQVGPTAAQQAVLTAAAAAAQAQAAAGRTTPPPGGAAGSIAKAAAAAAGGGGAGAGGASGAAAGVAPGTPPPHMANMFAQLAQLASSHPSQAPAAAHLQKLLASIQAKPSAAPAQQAHVPGAARQGSGNNMPTGVDRVTSGPHQGKWEVAHRFFHPSGGIQHMVLGYFQAQEEARIVHDCAALAVPNSLLFKPASSYTLAQVLSLVRTLTSKYSSGVDLIVRDAQMNALRSGARPNPSREAALAAHAAPAPAHAATAPAPAPGSRAAAEARVEDSTCIKLLLQVVKAPTGEEHIKLQILVLPDLLRYRSSGGGNPAVGGGAANQVAPPGITSSMTTIQPRQMIKYKPGPKQNPSGLLFDGIPSSVAAAAISSCNCLQGVYVVKDAHSKLLRYAAKIPLNTTTWFVSSHVAPAEAAKAHDAAAIGIFGREALNYLNYPASTYNIYDVYRAVKSCADQYPWVRRRHMPHLLTCAAECGIATKDVSGRALLTAAQLAPEPPNAPTSPSLHASKPGAVVSPVQQVVQRKPRKSNGTGRRGGMGSMASGQLSSQMGASSEETDGTPSPAADVTMRSNSPMPGVSEGVERGSRTSAVSKPTQYVGVWKEVGGPMKGRYSAKQCGPTGQPKTPNIYLIVGYFDSITDAAKARDQAAIAMQSNPRLNFPNETHTRDDVMRVCGPMIEANRKALARDINRIVESNVERYLARLEGQQPMNIDSPFSTAQDNIKLTFVMDQAVELVITVIGSTAQRHNQQQQQAGRDVEMTDAFESGEPAVSVHLNMVPHVSVQIAVVRPVLSMLRQPSASVSLPGWQAAPKPPSVNRVALAKALASKPATSQPPAPSFPGHQGQPTANRRVAALAREAEAIMVGRSRKQKPPPPVKEEVSTPGPMEMDEGSVMMKEEPEMSEDSTGLMTNSQSELQDGNSAAVGPEDEAGALQDEKEYWEARRQAKRAKGVTPSCLIPGSEFLGVLRESGSEEDALWSGKASLITKDGRSMYMVVGRYEEPELAARIRDLGALAVGNASTPRLNFDADEYTLSEVELLINSLSEEHPQHFNTSMLIPALRAAIKHGVKNDLPPDHVLYQSKGTAGRQRVSNRVAAQLAASGSMPGALDVPGSWLGVSDPAALGPRSNSLDSGVLGVLSQFDGGYTRDWDMGSSRWGGTGLRSKRGRSPSWVYEAEPEPDAVSVHLAVVPRVSLHLLADPAPGPHRPAVRAHIQVKPGVELCMAVGAWPLVPDSEYPEVSCKLEEGRDGRSWKRQASHTGGLLASGDLDMLLVLAEAADTAAVDAGADAGALAIVGAAGGGGGGDGSGGVVLPNGRGFKRSREAAEFDLELVDEEAKEGLWGGAQAAVLEVPRLLNHMGTASQQVAAAELLLARMLGENEAAVRQAVQNVFGQGGLGPQGGRQQLEGGEVEVSNGIWAIPAAAVGRVTGRRGRARGRGSRGGRVAREGGGGRGRARAAAAAAHVDRSPSPNRSLLTMQSSQPSTSTGSASEEVVDEKDEDVDFAELAANARRRGGRGSRGGGRGGRGRGRGANKPIPLMPSSALAAPPTAGLLHSSSMNLLQAASRPVVQTGLPPQDRSVTTLPIPQLSRSSVISSVKMSDYDGSAPPIRGPPTAGGAMMGPPAKKPALGQTFPTASRPAPSMPQSPLTAMEQYHSSLQKHVLQRQHAQGPATSTAGGMMKQPQQQGAQPGGAGTQQQQQAGQMQQGVVKRVADLMSNTVATNPQQQQQQQQQQQGGNKPPQQVVVVNTSKGPPTANTAASKPPGTTAPKLPGTATAGVTTIGAGAPRAPQMMTLAPHTMVPSWPGPNMMPISYMGSQYMVMQGPHRGGFPGLPPGYTAVNMTGRPMAPAQAQQMMQATQQQVRAVMGQQAAQQQQVQQQQVKRPVQMTGQVVGQVGKMQRTDTGAQDGAPGGPSGGGGSGAS